MLEAQWEQEARKLATEQGDRALSKETAQAEAAGLAVPTLSQMRRAIVEIDQLLRTAPTPIQKRYKDIAETRLRHLAVDAQAKLDEGHLDWASGDIVEAAGAQVRALDQHLIQHREWRGKPNDISKDFLCRISHVHVVPRPHAKPPAVAGVTTRTYRRRGLVWHRLIPEVIDGYLIDLQWFSDLSLSFRRERATVLGSVFEALSLVRDDTFENFVAREAPCDAEDETLARQVESACTGDVLIALWPELTMPPERRKKLVMALRRKMREVAPGKGPVIIAAGSWHEIEKGEVRNRLRILSGMGNERFFHDKSLPLESATLGIEQITPSFRTPVLVTQDALIAFAICRDFCDAQITKLYEGLDVDLVVVPSYGDAKTIRAHRQQASRISTGPGTRTFVVQQIIPDEVAATGTGYVLGPDADPTSITESAMVIDAPSVTHRISFKRV